jgi:hypothetical protein
MISSTRLIIVFGVVCACAAAAPDAFFAGEKSAPSVAQCGSVAGVLLQRDKGQWKALKKGALIADGATLIALPKADLQSKDGAVGVRMLADVGHRGKYPVLESAITLTRQPGVDLGVQLDRGLIVLVNQKKQGQATVRLQVRDATWQLHLKEPGTKVVVELYSRHTAGMPAMSELKTRSPLTSMFMLVVKGKVFLKTEGKGMGLTAPPGQALASWDDYSHAPNVEYLDKLPPEAKPLNDKEAKLFDKICQSVSPLNSAGAIGPAVHKMVQSDSRVDRLVGVTLEGAVDDLPGVLAALIESKHPEVRQHAVVVLRQWLGRGPGQTTKLYQALTTEGKYSKIQALTILQLLFGLREAEHANPGVYQLLIGYLNHGKLAVRELAHWQLVRLAPAGKDIPYDAAAPLAERQESMRRWQTLIPAGQLPPASPSPKK